MASRLAALRDWARSNAWLASAYRELPASLRHRVSQFMVDRTMRDAAFPALPAVAAVAPLPEAAQTAADGMRGVNLFAYFRGQFGLGEAARAYAQALIQAGYPVALNDIDLDLPHDFNDRSLEARLVDAAPHAVNLVFVNPDYFDAALARIGPERLQGRYLMACWFWELERVPDPWHSALEQVDEVLVASGFVKDAFRAAGDVPVLCVPLPLTQVHDSGLSRTAFGLDEQDFIFLMSFDFHSWVERKNPWATIQAFQRAFPGPERRVRLLVKTSNGRLHPEAFAALMQLARRDPRIIVRDGILERAHVRALQRCCDAYISLHRAEGFGLGLAECMAQGKPVIATGWSGNMEFMTPHNSCPVEFRLVGIGEGGYLHGEGKRWAEPDVDNAAAWMRRLVDDRAFASRIGEAASRDVSEHLSPARAAEALARRFDALAVQAASGGHARWAGAAS